MPEAELTKEQLHRQDEVDNACYALLLELAKASDLPWDIEDISEVREAIQGVLVDKRHIMSEMEFYPYIEPEPEPPLTPGVCPHCAKKIDYLLCDVTEEYIKSYAGGNGVFDEVDQIQAEVNYFKCPECYKHLPIADQDEADEFLAGNEGGE